MLLLFAESTNLLEVDHGFNEGSVDHAYELSGLRVVGGVVFGDVGVCHQRPLPEVTTVGNVFFDLVVDLDDCGFSELEQNGYLSTRQIHRILDVLLSFNSTQLQ